MRNRLVLVDGKQGRHMEVPQGCRLDLPRKELDMDKTTDGQDRPMVYIAGPLETSGTVWGNVRHACSVADMVLRFGGTPFVPHLYTFWAFTTPASAIRGREEWMELCLDMVRRSNALYRIQGLSDGASREVELALELGLPIMRDVTEAADFLGYELDT